MSDDGGPVWFANCDELEGSLQRLGPVAPGDLLVFGGLTEDMQHEVIEAVAHHYKRIAQESLLDETETEAAMFMPLIVFLGPDMSIEHLPADTLSRLPVNLMRDAGWVRAPWT